MTAPGLLHVLWSWYKYDILFHLKAYYSLWITSHIIYICRFNVKTKKHLYFHHNMYIYQYTITLQRYFFYKFDIFIGTQQSVDLPQLYSLSNKIEQSWLYLLKKHLKNIIKIKKKTMSVDRSCNNRVTFQNNIQFPNKCNIHDNESTMPLKIIESLKRWSSA